MDLSELNTAHPSVKSESRDPTFAAVGTTERAWPVVHQIGAEVAGALTPALDSVRLMQNTGRIDRAGLDALLAQIEQARHASMLGQQIARLAGGGIQQQPEALSLAQAVQDVLVHRQDELRTRGMAVKQSSKPVDVVADATLLSALLNALLDWSLRHTCTSVDLQLDTKAWPAHARLVCRWGHTPLDQVPAPSRRQRTPDCLSWQLLIQLAHTMSLQFERVDSESDTTLTLEFPHTTSDSLEGAASVERSGGFAIGGDSRPCPGAQVLAITLRREMHNQIKQTVTPMGLTLHCVHSVDDARRFCDQAPPEAIVYESVVYDSNFDSLRHDIKQQHPQMAWIEIVDDGDAFEISSFDGTSMARVGRDAIASALPSALMFELAKKQ